MRPLPIIALAAICGVGAYLALSPNDSATSSTSKSTSTSTSGTPKDQAVVAIESQIRSFDPRYSLDANSQYLDNLVHCSLIDFDKNGTSTPSLAAALPKWQSPTELVVEIKKGVAFSNGEPVTAKDVKATYDFFLQEGLKSPSPKKGAFKNIASIATKGDHTVQMTLKEPDATFVSNLIVGILPAANAGHDGALSSDAPVAGCGPFKVKSVGIGDVVLTANPSYSLSTKPKLSGIVFKVVKDEKTRLNKLKAGEIDLVQNSLNRNSITNLSKGEDSVKVIRNPGLKTTYLAFNMRDKLTGNLAVREAIAHAIDRKPIIDAILKGYAVEATTMLTPSDPYFSKGVEPISHNVAKAKAILDKAGLKAKPGEPYRFTLSYKTTTNATRQQIAHAIADQLKAVGIKVNVESMEWGRFKKDVEEGRAQMWSLAWVGFKDPDIYRYAFATESAPPNGGNRGFYSNPELDKLLAAGRTTIDAAKRKDVYDKVQKLVAAELPYVFLWHEENIAAFSDKLMGYKVYADGRYASLMTAYKN